MKTTDFPKEILEKRAIIYVRQSTATQVHENLESQRRQYELAEQARRLGFHDIVTIDDDLGKSASGTVARLGFDSMVSQVCQGLVGAIFAIEVSRLARNGREWHHLIELCGLVGARVVDLDGTYDPGSANDRLLLGLKGEISAFELNTIQRRMLDAIFSKARRGELQMMVPVGYVWTPEGRLEMNPDRRVQEAVHTVFRLFDELRSVRRVMLRMQADELTFPRPAGKRANSPLVWSSPIYSSIKCVLTNPIFSGAYTWGRRGTRTQIVNGRAHKSHGHPNPRDKWILIRDHHPAFISWERYEANQEQMRSNSYAAPSATSKSARGGCGLLSGLLRCRRCGRMLGVTYNGKQGLARYYCRAAHTIYGLPPCVALGSCRTDPAVAAELRRVVQPLAVEAALMAEQRLRDTGDDRRRALELEREQAAYEVRAAERRYHSVDSDNRLVAAELEARWNAALSRLSECEARLTAQTSAPPPPTRREELLSLAQDLEAAWNAPSTSMHTKQQLLRTLVREIVADVDPVAREVILVIHWHGGGHSELRVRTPRSGEHRMRTSLEADTLIREMAPKWRDEQIAAMLNRRGLRSGQGLTWTALRVRYHRQYARIPGCTAQTSPTEWMTMEEAAQKLNVTAHRIRALIERKVLPAKQAMKDAPWQIQPVDLEAPAVRAALETGARPHRKMRDTQTPEIPGLWKGGAS